MNRLCCGLVVCLLLAFRLEAEPDKAAMISWSPVHGVAGYMIEIQNEEDTIVFQKETNETNLSVLLPSGKYRYRLGSIARLKQPITWSDWYDLELLETGTPILTSPLQNKWTRPEKEIEIEGEKLFSYTQAKFLSRSGKSISVKTSPGSNPKRKIGEKTITSLRLSFDVSEDESDSYDLVLENPQSEKLTVRKFLDLSNSFDATFLYSFVPGLPDFRFDRPQRGRLWMGTFAFLGVFAYSEGKKADQIAKTKASDPLYLIHNDPVYYSLGYDSFLGANPYSSALSLYVYDRGVKQTAEYKIHQKNQRFALDIMALLYVAHTVGAFLWFNQEGVEQPFPNFMTDSSYFSQNASLHRKSNWEIRYVFPIN